MRASRFFRQVALAGAAGLTSLLACPSGARCSQAPTQEALEPALAAGSCPGTLYLESRTVRVFETSDNAQNMLHAACVQASSQALLLWRRQALASSAASIRACAAKMGAQGCLTGQAFTQPRCADRVCPLTQKCVVRLVRLRPAPSAEPTQVKKASLGAATPQERAAP